jgi:hypothetical protein
MNEKYIELVTMMDQCLFQNLDVTLEEAIETYLLNGKEVCNLVVKEIDELLSHGYPESEILAFVSEHSDFLENDSGTETLFLIKSLLS